MNDLGLLFIIIIILVLIYAIFNYFAYPMKDRIMIDRISIDELNQVVTDYWLVKRSFADGRFPYSTSVFSHWGVLLKTLNGQFFVIATQFNQITEVMKAYIQDCLVFTIEQHHPWFVFDHFEPANKMVTVKDITEWITLIYRNKRSGFLKYSCQCSVIDILMNFSTSTLRCSRGINAFKTAAYELIHYRRTALVYNANCLLPDSSQL